MSDCNWGRSGAGDCIVKGVWSIAVAGVMASSRVRLVGAAVWFSTSGSNLDLVQYDGMSESIQRLHTFRLCSAMSQSGSRQWQISL
jgi:hypothetical protein